MGRFGDMLTQIETIEKQGFNPITETYASRMGTTVQDGAIVRTTEVTPSGVEQSTGVVAQAPSGDPRQQISTSFVQSGFDDPFAGLGTERVLDEAAISTPYNQALQDPSLADPRAIIDAFNQYYLPSDRQIEVSETGGLIFEPGAEKEKKTEVNINYGKYWDSTQRKYVMKRENEVTGEVYEIYDDEDRFKKEAKAYREKQSKK